MAQQTVLGSNPLTIINENFDELYAAGAGTTATTTAKGPVELATNAETLAGTDTDRALTAASVAYLVSMMDVLSFTGAASAGACTLTGVKAGDKVLTVTGVASGTKGDQGTSFETTITVNDQIQQSSASNLSANVYLAFILRKS